MGKLMITLDEEQLVALVFAAAQSSCGFDRNSLPEPRLWHLHCCDYNEPIYEVLKQIDLDTIEDDEYQAYLRATLKKAKEFYA